MSIALVGVAQATTPLPMTRLPMAPAVQAFSVSLHNQGLQFDGLTLKDEKLATRYDQSKIHELVKQTHGQDPTLNALQSPLELANKEMEKGHPEQAKTFLTLADKKLAAARFAGNQPPRDVKASQISRNALASMPDARTAGIQQRAVSAPRVLMPLHENPPMPQYANQAA